jgi:hypothetical protein
MVRIVPDHPTSLNDPQAIAGEMAQYLRDSSFTLRSASANASP